MDGFFFFFLFFLFRLTEGPGFGGWGAQAVHFMRMFLMLPHLVVCMNRFAMHGGVVSFFFFFFFFSFFFFFFLFLFLYVLSGAHTYRSCESC